MSEIIRHQIKSDELAQLYNYWTAENDGPVQLSRVKINPAKICECLPNTLIIDITADARFKYRYVGTAVDGLGGEYLTNQYIEDVQFGGLCSETLSVLQNVVNGRMPSYFSGECKGADGMNRHFERIILPLSSDGVAVDAILAGLMYVPVVFPSAEEFEVATYG